MKFTSPPSHSAYSGLAITLVSPIFFPLFLEECDITGTVGRHVHELRVQDGAPVRRRLSGHHVNDLRVQDGTPVRQGHSGHQVHELRVRHGMPVRRGRSGHHVHELRVRDGALVMPACA